jgi:hypothetical protein
MKEALTKQIDAYLSCGGLFNPELANHVAVRDLLIACREALAKQEQGEPEDKTRTKFESWHKAEYVQPLERYAHTYKNMHVRNRWQGWLAALGIKE